LRSTPTLDVYTIRTSQQTHPRINRYILFSATVADKSDLIKAVALACAIGTAVSCSPERIIDYVIARSADFLTKEDQRRNSNIIDNAINNVTHYMDNANLRLQWKDDFRKFDQKSPISHQRIVQILTGMTVYAGTKLMLKVLFR